MGEERSWLRYGCQGCLVIVALIVLVVVAVFGVAAMQARNEQVETPTLVRESTAAVTTEVDEPAAEVRRGRVAVDFSAGEFEVRPAEPGEPLRIEARYDTSSYKLDEQFVERDGDWEYELQFERTGGGLMSLLKQLVGGSSPKLTVYLPPDSPLDLELDARQGGGTIELGGLWLRTASVGATQGGFDFRISDPLREPMERLTIEARMGGMNVQDVGNASPRALDVACSMGGLNLDLRGPWLNDSEISIDLSRGDVNLELPRDVEVEGLSGGGRGLAVDEDELARPTLRFTTSVSKGEIKLSGRPIGTD